MRQMTQCYDKHQYQTPEVLNKTWLEKGLLSDRMPRNRSEYHHVPKAWHVNPFRG